MNKEYEALLGKKVAELVYANHTPGFVKELTDKLAVNEDKPISCIEDLKTLRENYISKKKAACCDFTWRELAKAGFYEEAIGRYVEASRSPVTRAEAEGAVRGYLS